MKVQYDGKCELYCTDTGKTATADVLNFRKEEGLTAFIADSKLIMKYNSKHNIYIGSLMGMEFTTKGPKFWEIREGRQR